MHKGDEVVGGSSQGYGESSGYLEGMDEHVGRNSEEAQVMAVSVDRILQRGCTDFKSVCNQNIQYLGKRSNLDVCDNTDNLSIRNMEKDMTLTSPICMSGMVSSVVKGGTDVSLRTFWKTNRSIRKHILIQKKNKSTRQCTDKSAASGSSVYDVYEQYKANRYARKMVMKRKRKQTETLHLSHREKEISRFGVGNWSTCESLREVQCRRPSLYGGECHVGDIHFDSELNMHMSDEG